MLNLPIIFKCYFKYSVDALCGEATNTSDSESEFMIPNIKTWHMPIYELYIWRICSNLMSSIFSIMLSILPLRSPGNVYLIICFKGLYKWLLKGSPKLTKIVRYLHICYHPKGRYTLAQFFSVYNMQKAVTGLPYWLNSFDSFI